MVRTLVGSAVLIVFGVAAVRLFMAGGLASALLSALIAVGGYLLLRRSHS